jgi:Tol biopolymer transport system component
MKKVVISLVAAALPLVAVGQSPHLVTKEESLGQLLPGARPETLTVDAGFQHVAYVVKRGDKEVVVLNGVAGKEYDAVMGRDRFGMFFSPDGNHLAYVARRNGNNLVVVDGAEGKEYYDIYESIVVFSPDSKHFAYIAWTGPNDKCFAVLDGKEQKKYELVEGLMFSPDSQKFVYMAEIHWNRGDRLVVNGVEGKQYSLIDEVRFSPDSSRLAFCAAEWYPDRSFVVIDGKKGQVYNESVSAVDFLVFSPDSKHTAYRVINPSRSYTAPGSGNKHGPSRVDRPSQIFVVRDDVPEENFDSLGSWPVFSPDGQQLAYTAMKGTNYLMIVNGKVFDDRYLGEYTHSPVFSPDSKHIAYMSDIGTNWVAVVDGKVDERSKAIYSDPIFSPDSKRLVYQNRHGQKMSLSFGEFESGSYDQFLGNSSKPFLFDTNGTLHAIAVRNNEILRLEFRVAE